MRETRRWTALLLAGCLVLALAACGGADPAPDPSPTPAPSAAPTAAPSPAPADGGTLRVCLGGEPWTLDPALASGEAELSVAAALFEGLMRWSPQGEELGGGLRAAQVVPGLAQSYETAQEADGAWRYTFHLRESFWSDGKPVTAQDFVYAWQRLADPATGAAYAYLLTCVVNGAQVLAGELEPAALAVQAVDERTFQVTLTGPTPTFLELCAHPATAPLRQDAVEAGGDSWSLEAATLLTSGPYRLDRWDHGLALILERSPGYGQAQAGPDRLDFLFQEDRALAAQSWQDGEADLVRVRSGWEELAEEVVRIPYGAVDYLTFQTAAPPFDDPLVRQAFALAIDREALLAQLEQAGQVPAGALVPPGIADGAGRDFRAEGGDFLDPDADGAEAGRQRARELLAQAGHPDGAGLEPVVYLYNANPTHRAVAQALKEMWEETLGVSVTLDEQEWGSYLSRLHSGDFSLARGRWLADYDDPAEFLALWRSGNDGGYVSPDLDSLLDQAAQTADPAQRARLLHRAEAQLVGLDWALAPLYYEGRGYLPAEGWRELGVTPLGVVILSQAERD